MRRWVPSPAPQGEKKKKNPKVEPETDLSDPFQGKS
jgi:hypothetical protein